MKSPVRRVLVASLVAAIAALVGAGPALATGPSSRLRLAALQPAGVPVVEDDSAEALFTYRIEIDVLANDVDPEGGPLTIVGIESPPAFGTIDLTADNKIGYTPTAPLQQADQFTYRVADSNGASAVAQVTVSPYSQPVTLTPGKARIDIGGVPVGSYAVGRTRVTGPPVGAYGSIRFEAVDAADLAAAIAGTGYSLADAVSDPQAFAQQGWFMTRADTSVADIYFRPSATVGRVSVARAVLSTPTNGAPAEASLIVLGRSVDPASMTPPRAVDDAAATPASTSLIVQALANDLDSSGRGMYVGIVWACDDPIDFVFANGPCNAVPGSAQLTYAPGALQPYAFTFTPNDGFLGTTEVWYGMAEVEACMSPYQPGCALDSTIYMARAAIAANGVTLGVSKSGTGTGTVTSSSGISCGATCSVVLVPGTQVTLTATPDTGSTFAGWGGACSGAGACTLTVTTSATVSASFSSGPVNGPPYTLTVTPPAGGQIRAAGIRCGAGAAACSITMPAALKVGLEAVPSAGYTFSGWSGDCSGAAPAYLLALNGARTCGASFTPTSGGGSYSLTIAPAPTGGSVSGNGLACGNGGTTCAGLVRERDAGDADGNGGFGLRVYELGRGVQRDDCGDDRPGGRGEDLQCDVRAIWRSSERAAVHADGHAAGGRPDSGCGDPVRGGRSGVFHHDAGGAEGGPGGGAKCGLHVLGVER